MDKAKHAIERFQTNRPQRVQNKGDSQKDHTMPRSQSPKSNPTPKPKPTLDRSTKIAENAAKPSPQRNDLFFANAIFGIDVSVMEINKVTEFTPSFARLQNISRATVTRLMGKDDQFNQKLNLEMVNYHTNAMLWARLLDLRARRSHTVLNNTEREYHRLFAQRECAILQPIFTYLKSIGHITDKRGKRIYLSDYTLPTSNVGGKTG